MGTENFSANSKCIPISKVADESCGIISQSSALCPVTPDSNRENGEQKLQLSSPLTLVSSPANTPCFTCPTSPDTLFDSFAPAPDKFMLAPRHSKCRQESGTHVVRRLNFDFSHETKIDTISDEEQLYEIVYATILDAIVSEATKEVVPEFPSQVSDYSEDGFRTPESAPRLSWVAETCPGAPTKSSSKYRNIDKKICIDQEICRKLEF